VLLVASRPIGMPILSRRAKRVLIAIVAIIVVAILWFQFVNLYVNVAWFQELGHTNVFTTEVVTRILLFFIATVGVGGVVFASLLIAYRSRPVFVPSAEVDPLAPYRTIITARPKLFAFGISGVIGVICGFSAQGSWGTVQMWLHGGVFGINDPQFGHDVGFYVFRLPMYQLVLSWLFITIALSFVAVLVTQYVFGGIRIAGGRGRRITGQAALQLSLLVGAFVLVKAVQYWFDRYDLLFSTRGGKFTGASYTDVHAVLPAKIILLCIAAICAVGFIVGAFLRSIRLPVIALILLVLSSVLIGGVWPLILQQVVVGPNAITKEQPYIQRSITATREAYGLTDQNVTYTDYNDQSKGDPAALANDTKNVPNARLLDPNLVSETFTQREQLRAFYGFEPTLSVDRYTVDGKVQDYVVAARELNVSGLQDSQQGWINEHLVYTHGNGFVAAPANELSDGYPIFTVSDLQNKGDIPVAEPRVYYSPMVDDYSIVGSAGTREYDSDDANGQTSYYSYTGKGGVPVGNLLERLVFATKYGEANFLFSSEITGNSKIMYIRDPRERVQKVAPFLTVDTHPYPAVVDGRIVYIVDGYTTATNFPYSQQVTLSDATTNSLQAATGSVRQAATDVSYIRNSVKATVDAFDGTVTLYQVDNNDPVLNAWKQVFPGLITPEDQISPELREHFRYPEDLFEVQRELLSTYYVSDPTEFYGGSNFWQVPTDPTESSVSAAQPPYYLQVALPGQTLSSFQLTSALTWLSRDYAAAYVTAESDPEHYGKINVLKLPSSTPTPGPLLIQQTFNSNSDISNYVTTRKSGGSSQVLYGNLLTLPTDQGLLYVEPLYLQGVSSSSYPQLGQVLVWYAQRVGMGATLSDALKDAAKHAPVSPPAGQSGGTTSGTGATPSTNSGGATSGTVPGSVTSVAPTTGTGVVVPPGGSATADQALSQMQEAAKALDQAKANGDLAAIGAATQRLDDAVKQYLALVPPPTGAAGTTPASSSAGTAHPGTSTDAAGTPSAGHPSGSAGSTATAHSTP
jgi:uncharacterized membrane protein (UPF0182 family)